MAICEISNGIITISVDTHGAELRSLRTVEEDREYMWCGDAAFWGRVSPILFPLVGGLRDNAYRYEGTTYSMQKHGFARDMEFKLSSQLATELWFVAEANEDTRKEYPFSFRLEVGYVLEGRSVKVMWRVSNEEEETLYFSIGGHPAFKCPLTEGEKREAYYLAFDTNEEIVSTVIGTDGLRSGEKTAYPLKDGILPIAQNLFDHDALILEKQVKRVALLTPEKKPYVTVEFGMPVVGIWSPAGKRAPFVCIEPWCGICDSSGFDGSLEDRSYGNAISCGETFASEYTITVS